MSYFLTVVLAVISFITLVLLIATSTTEPLKEHIKQLEQRIEQLEKEVKK